MAQTVGDFFWQRLHQLGVRQVFGYPGDGINGLLGGLARFGTDKIQFVQARHEEMAAFMASAYAKFTGELGVCIATSGPGASHLITGTGRCGRGTLRPGNQDVLAGLQEGAQVDGAGVRYGPKATAVE